MTQNPTSTSDHTNTPSSGTGTTPNPAASALKDGLVGSARDLSLEVRDVATDVASEARKSAENKLGAGKDFAAEHLGSVAKALRSTSRQLRAEDSGITAYVDRAASSVEQVSRYLETRTLSQLMGDAEGYARREPAMFFGGAFLLGLVGGRFLKSATPERSFQGRNDASAMPQSQSQSYPSREGARPQLTQGSPRGSDASSPREPRPSTFAQESTPAHRAASASAPSAPSTVSSAASSSSMNTSNTPSSAPSTTPGTARSTSADPSSNATKPATNPTDSSPGKP